MIYPLGPRSNLILVIPENTPTPLIKRSFPKLNLEALNLET